jgi:hypothetical protein
VSHQLPDNSKFSFRAETSLEPLDVQEQAVNNIVAPPPVAAATAAAPLAAVECVETSHAQVFDIAIDAENTEADIADELRRQLARASLLSRLTQALSRSLDPAEVLRTAVSELGAHLEIDRCSLMMLDEEAAGATHARAIHHAGRAEFSC